MTTDSDLKQLIDRFGEEVTRRVVDASRDAIDEIEARCNQFGDCDFARVPSYDYTEIGDRPKWMNEQYETGCRLNVPVTLTDVVPLPFHCTHAVRTEQQGRFHSMRYLQHLAAQVHGCVAADAFRHIRRPSAEGAFVGKIALAKIDAVNSARREVFDHRREQY